MNTLAPFALAQLKGFLNTLAPFALAQLKGFLNTLAPFTPRRWLHERRGLSCGWRRGESIAGVAAKVVRWWRNCCGDCSVVALWSFGNDVGGASVVVGDGSVRGCGDGGMVGGGGVVGDRGCGDLVVVGVVVVWGALMHAGDKSRNLQKSDQSLHCHWEHETQCYLAHCRVVVGQH